MLQPFLKHNAKWPIPGCHLLGTETAAIMGVKLPETLILYFIFTLVLS